MSSYFSDKKKELLAAKNNNQRNDVVSWYDVENSELIVTFTIHERVETVAFKEGVNMWTAFYDWFTDILGVQYAAEKYGNIGDLFMSFTYGEVYLHDATEDYNSFFGVVRPLSITTAMNEAAVDDKHFKELSMDSTVGLDVEITTPPASTRPVGHKTLIKSAGLRSRQGKFVSVVNRNIRVANGSDDLDLILSGDRVVGKFAVLQLTKTPDSDLSVYEIGVSYLVQP
jgi:hypothetical protein